MQPVEISSAGMVTGVGASAQATCAAIRAGISGFSDTRFRFDDGWVQGCAVDELARLSHRQKLLEMAALAARECLLALHERRPERLPLFLCLSERDTPGLEGDGDRRDFLEALRAAAGLEPRDADSVLVCGGPVGGAEAVARAAGYLSMRRGACLVVGVESFLHPEILGRLHAARRLQTAKTLEGVIPGEAAGALLLQAAGGPAGTRCLGIGFGSEAATRESDQPLRADGLTQAIREAFASAGCGYEAIDYRISGVGNEQYGFKEACLGQLRTQRERKCLLDLWLPGETLGEVGAAAVPIALGLAREAASKGYAPGSGALCHFGNDGPPRAALVLRSAANGRAA